MFKNHATARCSCCVTEGCLFLNANISSISSQPINCLPLIQEKESCSVSSCHAFRHVSDFKIIDKASKEQEESWRCRKWTKWSISTWNIPLKIILKNSWYTKNRGLYASFTNLTSKPSTFTLYYIRIYHYGMIFYTYSQLIYHLLRDYTKSTKKRIRIPHDIQIKLSKELTSTKFTLDVFKESK